ncbi:cysteine hydrolase [Hydrogenophaga flava]|uniref:cysteine hydrolase n=1 Tax=Hydrogenophaga flava TaxID=65657 RepID=UPI000824E8DF|nr:cysteine hydrolase [Hydrogenophaga flava]
MSSRTTLLIIDPQNDFCDLPEGWRALDPLRQATTAPALPVSGAHADMLRLAALIDAGGDGIDRIVVTLDSHQRYDIAHPTFWQTGEGAAVNPFTAITAAQVRAGEYRPRDASALLRTLAYLDALEQAGRYTLMVWPVHCEIGSWGHNVHPAVRAAYNRWEDRRLAVVQKVGKGSNPWTEHYSALQAEVPDAADADTQLNTALIARLDEAERIVIAGEASSHCVKSSVEHLAQHLPSRRLDKLVLLTDAMSPVTGFEAQAAAFLSDLQRQGARLATCAEVLPLLQADA